MIPIPVGMKYTALAWGGVLKQVTCRHCATEFVYEIRRQVESQASAPLFIGIGSAGARAEQGAQTLLARTLENDVDLVLCPECKKLQPAMNRKARKHWIVGAVVLWIAVLIAAFLGVKAAEGARMAAPAWCMWVVVGGTVLFVAATVWILWRDFAGAGSDRGQRRGEAEGEGFARLMLPRPTADGWLWIRPTLFQSPGICAGCGAADPQKVLGRKFGNFLTHGFKLEAAVCAECCGRARMKRFFWGGVAFFAPVVAAEMLVMRMNHWDGIDLCVGTAGGAVVGGIVALIAGNWFLGRVGFPIRCRRIRLARDEMEIRFALGAAAEEFMSCAVARMQEVMARPVERDAGQERLDK